MDTSLTSKNVNLYKLDSTSPPPLTEYMPMAMINRAFVFSSSFSSAKPREYFLAFILESEKLKVPEVVVLAWAGGLSIIPIPFSHRGWYPSYSLIPPAAMSYQDSDTTFHPRLTLTQSPSHGKNCPVEIHTQSHSSVEDIPFFKYSKGFLAMAYNLHGLWSSCSQGEGPWHQATAKEHDLCWRHKMAGEEMQLSKDLREEFNFIILWGDTHPGDRNLGS